MAQKKLSPAEKSRKTTVTVNTEAKTSKITSMIGKTQTITIRKGKPDEYRLTLQYPGIARASQMRDDCQNIFGNATRTGFMQEAIRYLIVEPKITSLDFWNDHAGYDEATNKIMEFFTDCINGETYKEAD